MKKIFKIKNVCPFDLLRWERDEFYKRLDQEYQAQFSLDIEILEAELFFIKDGIKIQIITFKKVTQ